MADQNPDLKSFGVDAPHIPGASETSATADSTQFIILGYRAIFVFMLLVIVPGALRSQGLDILGSISYYGLLFIIISTGFKMMVLTYRIARNS